MATGTSTDTQTQAQIHFHQGATEMLQSHAFWAAIATVVVLLLKYLFNVQVTSAEVLTFAGTMVALIFGSSYAAAAHIAAMASLRGQAAGAAGFAGALQSSAEFFAKSLSAAPSPSAHEPPTPTSK